PIVAALSVGARKMLKIFGDHFYIFPWQEGSITDWNNISADQCFMAGKIQGMIHSIEQRETKDTPELSNIDWDGYIKKAKPVNDKIAEILEENRELLFQVQEELNEARMFLPGIECITDEDMDPKNVMWHEEKPVVIDLECLDHGNPVSHALQLSLQWAGVTLCDVDPRKIRAFFEGYLSEYDNGFRDYDRVFGLAYTWIEWLEYNIERSLGEYADEAEHRMAEAEVYNTLKRIRYIRDMEDELKKELEL
nr:phosphotransferase [Lachnospiraceae bacterium]